MAFGNLPGDHAKYNDVHTGAIANAIALMILLMIRKNLTYKTFIAIE
ncbi:MAG: hypothetical protein ACLTW7_15570 [Enterococcus sp.]